MPLGRSEGVSISEGGRANMRATEDQLPVWTGAIDMDAQSTRGTSQRRIRKSRGGPLSALLSARQPVN